MASYPTYDPSEFIGGISTQAYKALTSTGNHEPLFNKAISGAYAPGSTWKLFSAYAGLENGQITPSTSLNDPGYYEVPDCETASGAKCSFDGFERKALRTVNLSSALTKSSDVYFYKLGDDMWRRRGQLGDDALARTYRKWGFGADSGLGLAGEADGRVPDPKWLRSFAEELYEGNPAKIEDYGTWRSGTSLNTAIGQGDVLVTPLQLANGYATFANGGTLYRPQLVLQVAKYESRRVLSVTEPDAVRTMDMQPDWRGLAPRGAEGRHRHRHGSRQPSRGSRKTGSRWPARRARPRWPARPPPRCSPRSHRRTLPRSSPPPSSPSRAPAARRPLR